MASNNNGVMPDWLKAGLAFASVVAGGIASFTWVQSDTKNNASAIYSLRSEIKEIDSEVDALKLNEASGKGTLGRIRERLESIERKLDRLDKKP